MPTEVDNITKCMRCKQTRLGHYSRDHAFDPVMMPAAPNTLMDCSCGNRFRTDVAQGDIGAMHAALTGAGWRRINDAWKCPRCGQRHDRAQDKKREKERDAKSRQIGGW